MSRAPVLFLSLALGCATVTREDPPSQLLGNAEPGGGSGAGGQTGQGGGGFVPAMGGTSNALGGQGAGAEGGSNVGGSNGGSGGGSSPAELGGSGGNLEPVDAAPQFPSGTLLLEEDFEAFDAEAAGWVTTDGSAWAITTDAETNSSVYAQTETGSSGRHLAYAGDPSWTNVIVEVDFKVIEFNGSSSSYLAGVCVRVEDDESFYFIGLRSDNQRFGLRRFAGGGSNVTQSDFEEGVEGVWYHLRVEVNGPTLSAVLDGPDFDGQSLFTETDSAYPAGAVGLCTVRASAVFDNLRVTAP